MDTTNATDFQVADGISDIIFRGAHTDSTATIAYDAASDSFSATTSEGVFTGTIAANAMNAGTAMLSGTALTLSNATLTNKIDIVLTSGWTPNAAHATGTLALTSAATTSFTYKVGTGTSATADEVSVSINGISASNLGIDNTNVTGVVTADTASSAISIAIDTLNTARASIGAAQNRLEFASANIATTLENMEAARSNLLDLDIAAEMSIFTSKQILVQAGVAMLAQANQTPQNLLRLFQ